MAVSAAVVAGAAVVNTGVQAYEGRKARKSAENQAALEREQMASLAAKPEPVIPEANDDDTRRARRRSISAQLRRRGRGSTILTQDSASDTLG